MKKNFDSLIITFALLGLLSFVLYSNFPLEFKRLFIFGVEQVKENMDDMKKPGDNIKVNIPIVNIKKEEDNKHPGYCFIGDSDYTRHCVELQKDDNCVSGQIYKTREICVNPDLRY